MFPASSQSKPAEEKAGLRGVLGNIPACPSHSSEGHSRGWNQICLAARRLLQQPVLLAAGAGGDRSSCESSSDAALLHKPWELRSLQ